MAKTQAKIVWLDDTEQVVKISTGDKMRVNRDLPVIAPQYDEAGNLTNGSVLAERNLDRFAQMAFLAAKRDKLPHTEGDPEEFFDHVYEIDLVVDDPEATPEGEAQATTA